MRSKASKRRLRNEKGSVSLEFLGILPFYFMFFLLLWQVVASGYAVFTAKTAVNNAAKTFAATNELNEAIISAQETLGSSEIISYKNLVPSDLGNGKFKIILYTEHSLTFVPEQWRKKASLELEQEAIGKVMAP
ncbi:pilus assembly protein [Peribacillus saganii]|uniref:Pilus assembly protein n=1 Tax=Peribacillus saganii TaxID=2303992 RepID=A0A372LMG6_9BACI|nr:pilus assembly protein [Peribacillus saganii]RFU67769.1 pilus assembly protein [Peribacillus saganii]